MISPDYINTVILGASVGYYANGLKGLALGVAVVSTLSFITGIISSLRK
jgi:hypothetical protein